MKIKPKCKTCLGCNRLEDRNFKEVYRCENYTKGGEDVKGTQTDVLKKHKLYEKKYLDLKLRIIK